MTRYHRKILTYRRIRYCVTGLSGGGVLLLLSACSSTGFQSSIGEFGKLTSAASNEQATSLVRITQYEAERIRAQQAASHIDLRLQANCAAVLTVVSVKEAPDDRSPQPCGFVAADKRELEQPPQFSNIIALSKGLNSYAESLVELASDRDSDNKAFTSSVTGLATSLGGLDAAVQKATGADESHSSEKLGAIASLVDEAGRLYFAHQRNAALRKIIIAADPFVQDAARLLSGADQRIDLYDRAGLAQDLLKAQKHQSEIAASASPEELRAAQEKMYDLLTAFTQRGEGTERFIAIGKAHAKLAKAAAAGAKPAEIKEAILALIQLAGTIDKTADAFSSDKQEKTDAD